jgi:hypothetical protein
MMTVIAIVRASGGKRLESWLIHWPISSRRFKACKFSMRDAERERTLYFSLSEVRLSEQLTFPLWH